MDMIWLAYLVVVFSILQLLVALVNLVFQQPFSVIESKFESLVSVLIPARNEEKNIGNLLTDLRNQHYKNIEIIVFDDQSTDKTAEIVTRISASDTRIKLIHTNSLPDGWLGKNYACHSLSEQANGSYLLFLDSDVRIGNNLIINTVDFSVKHNLGLLSIFPKQVMKSLGELITVPIMNFILLSLLPLILVRKSGYPSLAAANGQLMLFRSSEYMKTFPHEKMKAEKVEDIKIARFYKQLKIPVACLTGKDEISCRMYENFSQGVNGFSKNVTTFFGNSFLISILFWLITTIGFLPVIFWTGIPIMLLYFFSVLMTRIFISVASRQNAILNLILLIPQQVVLGIFIYRAFINKLNKQYHWKGRNIS